MTTEETFKIKPLWWYEVPFKKNEYEAHIRGIGEYRISLGSSNSNWFVEWFVDERNRHPINFQTGCASLEEAKAFAESHWKSQILNFMEKV